MQQGCVTRPSQTWKGLQLVFFLLAAGTYGAGWHPDSLPAMQGSDQGSTLDQLLQERHWSRLRSYCQTRDWSLALGEGVLYFIVSLTSYKNPGRSVISIHFQTRN